MMTALTQLQLWSKSVARGHIAACMIRIDRALRGGANTMPAWGVRFAVASLACTQALACPAPSLERTIIFKHVPTDVDAPVIAEVMILDRRGDVVDPSNGIQMAVLSARVDRVVKGRIDEGALKVVTELSDCSRGPDVGSHGFVAGELRVDSEGNPELVAISERLRKVNAQSQPEGSDK
jgi:hypothetical protein